MPEPITIIAGSLSIVNGAITATKSLIDFIDSIRNAPRLISDLKSDVAATQSVIVTFGELLKGRDEDAENLPADLRACLSSANRPLEDCKTVAEEFENKLKKWFRDSMWDRLKPTLKEGKINMLRTRLRDTRDVLDLALNVCSIKFRGIRADEARKFEEDMGMQLQQFFGKLQGLEISRQEVLDAAESVNDQYDQLSHQQMMIAHRLGDHEHLIREAIKFCAAGLLETGKKTGNIVKSVKTIDTARVLVAHIIGDNGDIGGGLDIGEMIAEGNSRQVAITNDPNFALKFLA